MINNSVFSIGVMSGTSLDGVDLVYVSFDKSNYKNVNIIHAQTIPYSKEWKEQLKNAISFSKENLKQLDVVYGNYLGELISNFIYNFGIKKVDFIASHGHTVLHQPKKGITLQIGNGKEIAKKTNCKVVCDFRTQDVKLGGQGAPLVPIGDELLFSAYEYCINLGGFSNVSFVKEKKRIAFDICPVNIVLNHYVSKMNLEYDESGKIASTGKLNHQLLKKLNNLDFYKKEPPKSLGLEWVTEEVFPLINRHEEEIPNILNTFVEHIAYQITKITGTSNSILFTGGGTFNTYLMQRVALYSEQNIELSDKNIINFKEALIFSLLGLLKLEGKINCLKSVTGAKKNHSSGVVFYP